MPANPFHLRWNKGWSFLFFLDGGTAKIEAIVFGIAMTAPQAAGVIHTDFEKGFIRALTISYQNLIDSGSIANAKTKGLLRSEGKEYVVNEGDVMEFLFNV